MENDHWNTAATVEVNNGTKAGNNSEAGIGVTDPSLELVPRTVAEYKVQERPAMETGNKNL